jgi:ribosomal protein L11 methyltransferase
MDDRFVLLEISCDPAWNDILEAELALLEFDSFLENENGFQASIEEEKFDRETTESLINRYREKVPIEYSLSNVVRSNWNELWEKNYPFLVVEEKVLVRASFHVIPERYPFEIIINPKMSFGTGHHETTYMMIQSMLGLDLTDKTVLDAGCGTGILSIFAEKMGAAKVTGIDIDDWAVENATENVNLNNCSSVIIIRSSAPDLDSQFRSDFILANINRNVLMEEIPSYFKKLNENGTLVMSGFYQEDVDLLEKTASVNGLLRTSHLIRNHWSALVFEKKTDYFSTKY